MMRLDKFLSHTLLVSRKDVKKLLKEKRITVNGEIERRDACKIDEVDDVICFDDEELYYQKYVYYMLNKPQGVVSATRDNVYPTVLSLLDDERPDLFPAGRLDVDTTGLLLITNDGKLSHYLLSPKHHVDKVYDVYLSEDIDEAAITKLKQGIVLDEDEHCQGADVNIIEPRHIELTIHEGKFHQVKRMMKAVGNEVVSLRRISFGPLHLDESLEEGMYRNLYEEELVSLYKLMEQG